MKVVLSVVPQGGAEAEFVRTVEMPVLPKGGQQIEINTDEGMEFYRVAQHNRWSINQPNPDNSPGEVDSVTLIVRPIRGPAESDHHQQICESYEVTEEFSSPFL